MSSASRWLRGQIAFWLIVECDEIFGDSFDHFHERRRDLDDSLED